MSILSDNLLEEVEFYNRKIEPKRVIPRGLQVKGPFDPSWTRIEIEVPDFYNSTNKIGEWIRENLEHRWGTYNYAITNDGVAVHKMVLLFEAERDAIMFKLRDGHRAWEMNT